MAGRGRRTGAVIRVVLGRGITAVRRGFIGRSFGNCRLADARRQFAFFRKLAYFANMDLSSFKTPGQLISSLLAEREWTKRTLAIVMGMEETAVNKICGDKRPVTAEIALVLEEVFQVSAEHFLSLQSAFDLALARLTARPDPGRHERAQLFGRLPITDMIKRGWLNAPNAKDVPAVQRSLETFFEADQTGGVGVIPHAARRSKVSASASPVQLAWLYRVRHIASEMIVAPYTLAAGRAAVKALTPLLSAAEEARKVPRILAEHGIRFVVVESLPSAKMDGACFWLDDRSPVIGMSIRFDRIDNFWFVLRHELEHVIQGHGKEEAVLDYELEGIRTGTSEHVSEDERIANQAAAEFCVPSAKLQAFIARKAPYFATRDLLGFAKTLGVHPGLVAGQIQRATGRYELFRDHLVKVRAIVTPGAVADGWGDIAPVGK